MCSLTTFTCFELKLQKPMALTSPRSTSLSMAAHVSSRDTPLNITWGEQVELEEVQEVEEVEEVEVEEVQPLHNLSVWVLGHIALVLAGGEAAGPVDEVEVQVILQSSTMSLCVMRCASTRPRSSRAFLQAGSTSILPCSVLHNFEAKNISSLTRAVLKHFQHLTKLVFVADSTGTGLASTALPHLAMNLSSPIISLNTTPTSFSLP